MEDRIFLILATIAYLVSTAQICYAFGAKKFQPGYSNLVVMLSGFVFHTIFLYLRGKVIGHCPLTNLFETTAFLSWSVVLNYLVIGPMFRMSLLGTFAAPLVSLMNLFVLVMPEIDKRGNFPQLGWKLEMHASLSLLAYGTLAISAVAAVMFLVSNHYLKTRAVAPMIFRMPALGQLDHVNFRVGVWGFLLLTFGLGFGFSIEQLRADYVKIIWSLLVWGLYAAILYARYTARLSPVKFAVLSVVFYGFVLLTFWGINSLSLTHQF
jgi:ABC-type uncharacterized transport system permease subunit